MNKGNELIQAQRAVWEYDPARYFEQCLKIRPKIGDLCYFHLNKHQQKIQAAIDRQRREGRPVRIIVLKPRQTGASTVSAANLFHGVRFYPGDGMVVSKDLNSAEHIFSIIQRFYHYLPSVERKSLQSRASNRKELKFEEPHGGRILVETAADRSAGHSFTLKYLLLSEVARWLGDRDDLVAGLLNAVSRNPGTFIIVESVANGMSGWFWQEWHRQNSDYEKVFLPWFEHTEYQKELPIEENLYWQTLTQEEMKLVSLYKLSLPQIEWRRWAIHNNCRDDVDKFKEQYPANPREAFISTGNSFFHMPTIDTIKTGTGVSLDLRWVENQITHQKELLPIDNPRGMLTVWKRPQSEREYVIGADLAEGIEIDGAPAGDKRDYSVADVLDRYTGEQVAQLYGQVTPDEFGRQLSLLGRWYNRAFIGPEMNSGYGQHLVDTMVRENYPSHRIYSEKERSGWKTTQTNKKPLLSQLDMALRRGEVIVNSEFTVQELRSFINRPNGSLAAGPGGKDDRVMSLAIAYQMAIVAPRKMPSADTTSYYGPHRYRPHRPIYQTYRAI